MFRDMHEFAGWAGHGPPWMRSGRRRKFKRGMLKYALLHLIAEEPRHGYDLMRFFGQRGWGALAAGTLYPLLDKLEQAGLVQSREEDGKRVYSVTDAGHQHLRGVAEEIFNDDDGGEASDASSREDLHGTFKQLATAVFQAGHDSKPETAAAIRDVLKRARKEIYTLLANE